MACAKIGGEFFVFFGEARPETWFGLPHGLRIEFRQMEAGLHSVVKLVGFQLADGDGAHQGSERLFAQADEDFGQLHKSQRSMGAVMGEGRSPSVGMSADAARRSACATRLRSAVAFY